MKLKLPNAKTIAKIIAKVVAYLSVAIGVGVFLHGFWLLSRPGAYIAGGLLLAGTGFFSGLEDKSDDSDDKGWE